MEFDFYLIVVFNTGIHYTLIHSLEAIYSLLQVSQTSCNIIQFYNVSVVILCYQY